MNLLATKALQAVLEFSLHYLAAISAVTPTSAVEGDEAFFGPI